MRIEKQNYSRSPWRLLTDKGGWVCVTIKNEAGDVIFTDQPVCGATKQEVTNFALGELERLAVRNIELEARNRQMHDLLDEYIAQSELNVCA